MQRTRKPLVFAPPIGGMSDFAYGLASLPFAYDVGDFLSSSGGIPVLHKCLSRRRRQIEGLVAGNRQLIGRFVNMGWFCN
jgi:hypothetical protein